MCGHFLCTKIYQGLAWAELKKLWKDGFLAYITVPWNLADIFTLANFMGWIGASSSSSSPSHSLQQIVHFNRTLLTFHPPSPFIGWILSPSWRWRFLGRVTCSSLPHGAKGDLGGGAARQDLPEKVSIIGDPKHALQESHQGGVGCVWTSEPCWCSIWGRDDCCILEGDTAWIEFGMIYACLKDYGGIYVKCIAFAGWEELVMVSLRVTDVAKTWSLKKVVFVIIIKDGYP